MTVAAAAAAWLGGAIVLLSDGRRGLALGVAILGAALAALALLAGHDVEAAALVAGGVVAGALRLRSGPPGWGVMPAGSTPRLILAVVAALIALWLAAAVTTGDGASLRFAVTVLLAMLAVRLLLGAEPAAAATAASGIALALGAGALVASGGATIAACFVAAVVAAALPALPRPESHGA